MTDEHVRRHKRAPLNLPPRVCETSRKSARWDGKKCIVSAFKIDNPTPSLCHLSSQSQFAHALYHRRPSPLMPIIQCERLVSRICVMCTQGVPRNSQFQGDGILQRWMNQEGSSRINLWEINSWKASDPRAMFRHPDKSLQRFNRTYVYKQPPAERVRTHTRVRCPPTWQYAVPVGS